jgi:RNA polymerase sigma factor (sigma-70 family)
MNDWRLLQQYIDEKSEAAFGELLSRHIKMVYWTCRRELRNAQLAEDAAQEVFLLLARKANSFYLGVSISGWLFNTSRLVCRNMSRSEYRRRRLESELMLGMDTTTNASAQWPGIERYLNDALSALSVGDRDIVLRRYVDGFSLREIAVENGTSEDAAGKRASRAIEKLRKQLTASGVVVSSDSLASLLIMNSAPDVPGAVQQAILLSARRFTQSRPHAATGHSLGTILHKGAYIIMQLSKGKIAALTAAAAFAILGTSATVAVYNIRHEAVPPEGIDQGFQWVKSRLGGPGTISGITGGPFWMAGIDNRIGLTWMVRGAGQTKVVSSDGTLNMESNNLVIPCTLERQVVEYLIGCGIQDTERFVKTPELVIKLNGVTTYESGYGIYPVRDALGQLKDTIQLRPHG